MLSDYIFNSTLYNKWENYKCDAYKLTLPVTERHLYQMNVDSKILAFCYALAKNTAANTLTALFRIIPHPGVSFEHEMATNYKSVVKLPDALNVPLNVFKAKSFHITVNASDHLCADCTRPLFNDAYCFNESCRAFRTLDLSATPVSNTRGRVLFDLSYVYDSIALKNNGVILSTACTRCNSCKRCRSKGSRCHHHKVCKHGKLKTGTATKSKYHELNMLAYEIASS